MNTKKMLSIVAISCSLLFLAGCGGAKTADVSTGTVPTVTEDTQMPNVPGTKNATKDQCIEMMAYAFKFSQDQAQGTTTTTWAQKASDLEVKYRADGVEYEQTCNEFLASDPSFMQSVQKRVEELK